MTENKPIILDGDVLNAKDFCPYYQCETDCYEAVTCQWFVDTLQQLTRKTQECDELKERFKKFHDKKLDENADLLCKLHKEECLRFKAEQKLKRIRKYCKKCEKIALMGSANSEVILQIIDEVER